MSVYAVATIAHMAVYILGPFPGDDAMERCQAGADRINKNAAEVLTEDSEFTAEDFRAFCIRTDERPEINDEIRPPE